jgi:hemoglobin-like flavoprotein
MDPTKNNPADYATMVSRAITSAIPWVGGAIGELLAAVIPGQRVDRVVDFLKRLEKRMEELERTFNKDNKRTVDLFESTVIASARAVTPDRNRYLANLMAESVDVTPEQYEVTKKILQALEELTDKDIEVLKAYASFSSKVALERDWPRPQMMTVAEREKLPMPVKVERESARISLHVHQETLVRCGLLSRKDPQMEARVVKGEVYLKGGSGKPEYTVTTFGQLLLVMVFGREFDAFQFRR